MKTIWIVLTLLFGALVFVLGCMMGGDTMQYVEAGFLFVGLIGLFERIWGEEGVRYFSDRMRTNYDLRNSEDDGEEKREREAGLSKNEVITEPFFDHSSWV